MDDDTDIYDRVERGDRERLAPLIAEELARPDSELLDDNLLHAAWHRNRGLMRWLLDQGISPNRRDTYGGTVLMCAAADDKVEIVELLIARGAEPSAANEAGETAFSYACANNSLRSAKLLHAAGADVNTVDAGGGSPLDWAACWSDAEFCRWAESVGCRRVDV